MKKFFVVSLAVVVTLALAVTAFAVPAGKTVEFDGKGAGKVVFDGKLHADKGNKCADCHQHEGNGSRQELWRLPQRHQSFQRERCGKLRKVPQEIRCHYPAVKPSRS